MFSLYRRLRETFFGLTREFRFSPQGKQSAKGARTDLRARIHSWFREATLFVRPLESLETAEGVDARAIWEEYREHGRGSRRLIRAAGPIAAYVLLCWITFWAFDANPFDDPRGDIALWVNKVLVIASGVLFVALAFLTMDAALLSRRFIQILSGPTKYPRATYLHFSRILGEAETEYLDEWIDVQLIADITERVGWLVYYPCWLLLALALARNGWWDTLSWPTALVLVFVLNIVLALASAVTLQMAARRAKQEAERSLDQKARLLKAETAASEKEKASSQAAQLLDEIRNLRRGAFVPFWQNPVVGAITLSSGSMTLIQLVIWIMGR
jgi:membrane protein implicated in regulation of membrane protease activity